MTNRLQLQMFTRFLRGLGHFYSRFSLESATDPRSFVLQGSSYSIMSSEIKLDTRFLEQSFSMEWRIDNFGKIPFADLPSLRSPPFKLGGMSKKSCWQLKVYKRVRMDEDSLGFRLGKEEGHDSQWYCVKMSISVEADDMYQVCISDAIIAEPSSNSIIYVKRREFDEGKVGILYASDIIVTCNILYIYQDDKIPQNMEDVGISTLIHDLELLYNCKLYCDITLVAESIKIPAHKCILSSRGFKASLVPNELQVLKLDLKDSVATAMLEYIYTGKVPTSVSDVSDLYRAICDGKYGLSNLKQRCMYILLQNNMEIVCSDEDVCESPRRKIPKLE